MTTLQLGQIKVQIDEDSASIQARRRRLGGFRGPNQPQSRSASQETQVDDRIKNLGGEVFAEMEGTG